MCHDTGDPADTMLSKISQSVKYEDCMIPHMRANQSSQIHKEKKTKHKKQRTRMVVSRDEEEGEGERNAELPCNGLRVSVYKDENVLETDDGDGCTTMQMYRSTTELYT